ncbi:hypothetical protein GUA46_04800 [Muricauda sp. HICW]|uniref:YceK/YidQ family lipoprotein n=1 Tax=Flagellimonas chongwuensis TaxID=2697365 RepID=A0A850N8T1_9FLAO|nr:hypothetical protein [Allomuricauda chongwuensis]NVN17651.1 hypothetical protein [Allomuricauda chongwuensis]
MKKMKNVIALGLMVIMLSSCATIFGGKVTPHQKTKPAPGEQQREVRVVALIADLVFFWPGAIVDFATGAIYRPKR